MGVEVFKDWQAWAVNRKDLVYKVSQAYSGDFMKELCGAFMFADSFNTRKILKTWPDEFKKLHQMYQHKRRQNVSV